ncbi:MULTISPECIES: TonB-dependent receptor [unclassified Paraburkholderia]|uniref:TonB-dependent receptor n=1 Tax=unclassified Paraburkholderia TaxID=2615204 RepID=UPI002AAF0FA2|nr:MULTISPECIES: TonB-dependent receptor [unclassified Paraburkholderia]
MKRTRNPVQPPGARRPSSAIGALAAALLFVAGAALAQDTATHQFHLAAQPLNRTLLSIAAQSGVALSYDPKLVETVTAAPVSGELTAQGAIAQALKGTGLEVVITDSHALSVRRVASATATEDARPKVDRPKRPAPPTASTEVSTTQLGTVTVSAARTRREDPQRAPTSSYRVTGSELQQQHITSLADLQQLVPGLNVQSTDPSDTQITIRGIGDGGGQTSGEQNIGMPSSVAVYLDNVYLPRPGMLAGALADVDYVDVLSGAQGTLFGANSTGGVIDIHTPLPSFKLTGSESLSIAERGTVLNHTMLSGPISDTVAGRIDYVHNSTNGDVTNISNGHTLNGNASNAVRGQLLIRPSSQFSLRLSADYDNENGSPTPVLYGSSAVNGVNSFLTHSAKVGNNVVYGGSDHVVALDDENSFHLVQGGASAEANYRFDNGYNLRSVSAYRYFSSVPSTADSLSVPVYANSGTQFLDRSWLQDVRLDSPKGKYFDFALGATYMGENQSTQAFTRYADTTLPNVYYDSSIYDGLTVIRDGTLHDETWSGFGQGTFHATPRLDITAGLRLTYDKKGGQFVRYNKQAFNSGYLTQYNTLPSATLNFRYLITRELSSYLALSYGEKAGGLNVSSGAAAKEGLDSLVIRPERTKSAELGIKGTLLDGTLNAKADVFLTYVNDFQTQGYDPTTQSTYLTNAGTFRSRGAEFSLQYTPDDHVLLQTSAVYNDARYLNYHHAICPPEVTLGPAGSTAVCDLTGNQVFNAPKLTFNATARYTWHTLNGLNSYVSARYSYRTWTYGTVDDSSFARIPGYGLVAISAGTGGKFSRGSWTASVWVNNLFNKTYYRRLVESDYGSVVGWIGEPRTIGGTLTYQF